MYLFWYCILTEEKGVDLGQKKDSYFGNCCHNWPITGKTAVSYDLFWDDWRLTIFYTPQSISWIFFALSFYDFFFWCAVENEGFHLFQCSSNQLFFFIRNMFSLDLRMLTEANINSAWQSVLPKRQDTKQALGTDAVAWRWSLPIFTNNALSDLSPFMI